jgi:sulfite exporter TauE/SafE
MLAEAATAAFLAGMGTGAHCALMCGPLACALHVKPVGYHVSRVIAYTAAGALCGGLGEGIRLALRSGPSRLAPWLLLLVLVSMACNAHRFLPAPSGFMRWSTRLRLERTLGWFTPLIPCGPLWLMLGGAAATGNTVAGALLLACFGTGTLALYGALQHGIRALGNRLGSGSIAAFQKIALWAAVAMLAWRIWNPSPHGCCTF